MTEMGGYGVAVRLEGGDHVVSVRDLPEVVTSGDSLDDALQLAADAIAVVIEGRLEDGAPVPAPSPILPGEHRVALPAVLDRSNRSPGEA